MAIKVKGYDPTRVHTDEEIVGERAKFHVYYVRPSGKGYFDPSWAESVDAARDQMQKLIGKKSRILRIVELDQTIPVRSA